jgi:chromosome segregation ATPase
MMVDSLIIALNGQRRELMEYKRKLQSVTDKLNGKDQEYKEQEQKLEALLKEKDDLENELRQTQNTEHIQHLNSVLRNKNEIIASLTDKIDMYREMRNSKIAEIEFWRNKYDTANTEKHEEEKEIQKLIVGLYIFLSQLIALIFSQ